MYNISRGQRVTPFDKTYGKDWNRFISGHTRVAQAFRDRGYLYVYKKERVGHEDDEIMLILADDFDEPTSSAEFRITDVYPYPIPQEKRVSLDDKKHHLPWE